jgi:hypothetical protein
MEKLFNHQYFSENSTERRAWKAFENMQEIIQGVTCHCNFIFCVLIWIFFMNTLELSLMNMGKGSIRIFTKWERGTVEYQVKICWLTSADVL